jgi:hypothetical protein
MGLKLNRRSRDELRSTELNPALKDRAKVMLSLRDKSHDV